MGEPWVTMKVPTVTVRPGETLSVLLAPDPTLKDSESIEIRVTGGLKPRFEVFMNDSLRESVRSFDEWKPIDGEG